MALRDVLGFTGAEDGSVVGEMLEELTEVFAAASDGSYSIDEVLFTLALSVIRLESALIDSRGQVAELKANLFNLETRLLEAGVPLAES